MNKTEELFSQFIPTHLQEKDTHTLQLPPIFAFQVYTFSEASVSCAYILAIKDMERQNE